MTKLNRMNIGQIANVTDLAHALNFLWATVQPCAPSQVISLNKSGELRVAVALFCSHVDGTLPLDGTFLRMIPFTSR